MTTQRDLRSTRPGQQTALARAIAANPDDPVARLVFADWLEEHGYPEWAELIRLLDRLSKMAAGDPDRVELHARVDRLEPEVEAAWHDELQLSPSSLVFKHGLPTRLVQTPEEFGESAERVFAIAPVSEWAVYNDFGEMPKEAYSADWLDPALDRPELALVSVFDLHGLGVSVANVASLLSRAGAVRALDLSGCKHLRRAVAGVLAGSPALAGVETLELADLGLGAADIHALAAGGRFPGLGRLNLSGNVLHADGAVEVAAAGWPLTALNLWDNRIGPRGAAALAASRWLGGLEELDLAYNLIRDNGLEVLVRSAAFPRLRELDLTRNRITGEGIRTFLASPNQETIRRLYLNRTNLLPWDAVFALYDALGDRLQMVD